MVIHYIWVKDFQSFKQKGVNLSSKYFITFETTSVDLDVTGTLRIKLNPNYIDNFFEKKEIKDVAAIIGKNGAGKSTILEYIKSHFPQGLEANVSSDLAVYSFFNDDGEEMDFTVIYPNGWKVKLVDETGLFQVKKYVNMGDLGEAFRFASDLGKADYIFYSYNLHYNQELTDWHGLKNISTSALLVENRKRAAEERWKGGVAIEFSDALTNDLQHLAGNEISKALQLLISEFRKDIPFNPPEALLITISKLDRTYFKKHDKFNDDVFNLLTQIDKKRDEEPSYNKKALIDIYISTILNFLVTERKYSSDSQFIHKVKLSEGEDIKDFVIKFFKSTSFIRHPDIRLSEDVPEFFDLVERMISDKLLIPSTGSGGQDFVYGLTISKGSSDIFNHFFHLYLRIKGITDFLDFRWRNLSTWGAVIFIVYVPLSPHRQTCYRP